MTGQLALVGSGEYLEVMLPVEAALLADRPKRFVQVPTAAAPEGDASLERWTRLGRTQADRLGVEAVPLLVRDRADAEDPALAALVDGAGLIYLSGGSPTYLAKTLRGTAVWAAIEDAWRAGASLAGCSAGAMALTSWVPALRSRTGAAEQGLGAVPSLRVIPHFDRFVGWLPDVVGRYLARAPDGTTVLGIDEDTALVWDGVDWKVHGRQSVWVLEPTGRTGHPAGDVLPLPLPG